MGIFDFGEPVDHNEQQVEVHQEALAERQEELDKIEGVDTPNAKLRAKELKTEIRQLAVQIHQLREQKEKEGGEIKSYDRDSSLFRD